MTPTPATNNSGPLIPGNLESATQSPDITTRLCSKGLIWFGRNVAIPAALGTFSVLVNETIRSKMNQAADDFLNHHCSYTMTLAETKEYGELTPPFFSVTCAQVAVMATAFFIADGGLCRLYDAGKSVYDRACSYYAAPPPIENQTEEV